MLFVLPLQGLSAAMAHLLGPVHFHTEDAAASLTESDPLSMSNWQDFRRVNHVRDAAVHLHSHASAQMHVGLGRHHHANTDASVLVLGEDDQDNSTGNHSLSSDMSLMFVSLEEGALRWQPPSAAFDWPMRAEIAIASCDGRRLDRPPKA